MQEKQYFHCPTKDEDVTITIEQIDSTPLNSPIRKKENGRITCSDYDDKKCTNENCLFIKGQ